MTLPTPTETSTTASRDVLRGGVKTSEFWLTVLTVVLYAIGAFVPDTVAQRWGLEHGWVGGLVVAVYIAARGYLKATALKL